jgi:hypothetical protein
MFQNISTSLRQNGNNKIIGAKYLLDNGMSIHFEGKLIV